MFISFLGLSVNSTEAVAKKREETQQTLVLHHQSSVYMSIFLGWNILPASLVLRCMAEVWIDLVAGKLFLSWSLC